MQVHGFLKERDVYLNYSPEDLEQDMQTLRQRGSHGQGSSDRGPFPMATNPQSANH
jgi:hypothetical protein